MDDLEHEVREVIGRNRWMVLSTSGLNASPQGSVVMYASDGSVIYVLSDIASLKVRNIQMNGRVGVTIPFYKNFFHRLMWIAPPAAIHFKGEAVILSGSDSGARELYRRVRNYELPEDANPETVWIMVKPSSKVACYGVGVSFRTMRDPEKSRKIVELTNATSL